MVCARPVNEDCRQAPAIASRGFFYWLALFDIIKLSNGGYDMAKQRKETQPDAEVTEMQETQHDTEVALNADGLVPGQTVDWATLVRIEAERKSKNVG